MKIKDVEQQVGISVHSIRFYEEAGLIQINRKKDSNYREFSEEDVNKLKEIKLFRTLGITMEEIRRYYAKEITLTQLMDHHQRELKSQNEDMKRKEKLCEDIKQGNVPLVPYVVERYREAMDQKKDRLPYAEAGSLLTRWGEEQYSKKRMIMGEVFVSPFLWIFISGILFYTFMIPEIFGSSPMQNIQSFALLISIPVTILLCYMDYIYRIRKPGELYEFCEKGIYYVNKDTKCTFQQVRQAIRSGNHQNCYDFVSYDDIRTFKVWYRTVARTGVTGANVYQVDFRIFTNYDEMIVIDTGIIGTTDEKVRITAELLKQYAQKVVDPFHILEHLDDDRETFYAFLDGTHRKREHQRLGIKE